MMKSFILVFIPWLIISWPYVVILKKSYDTDFVDSDTMTYMIIGGDSFLGRNIAERLRVSHERIITTSRKKKNVAHSCMYLDLREDVSSWPIPENVDVVFFCAAITSIEHCWRYPAESRVVNVEHTIALITRLVKEGIAIIFPSTNLVFDGQSAKKKLMIRFAPVLSMAGKKQRLNKRSWRQGTRMQ
ncbi:MAG: NAD-dependent epimerase/dehydratase family protein [bacterium]